MFPTSFARAQQDLPAQPEARPSAETVVSPEDEKAAPIAAPAILTLMAHGCVVGVSSEILFKSAAIYFGAEETISEGDLVLACVLGAASGGFISSARAGATAVLTGVKYSPTLSRIASQSTGVTKIAFDSVKQAGKKYAKATLKSWVERDCDLHPSNLVWDDLVDLGFWHDTSLCVADSLYRNLIGFSEINVESSVLVEVSDPIRPVGFRIEEENRLASIVRPGVNVTLSAVMIADPGTYTFRLGVIDSHATDHILSQQTVVVSEEGFQEHSVTLSSSTLASLAPPGTEPARLDLFFEAEDGAALDLRWEGDPITSVTVDDENGQSPPIPMLSVETSGLQATFKGRIEDVDGDVIEDLTLEITGAGGTEIYNFLPAAIQISPTEWEFTVPWDFEAGFYDVVLSVSNQHHLRRTAATHLRMTSAPMSVDLQLSEANISQAEPFAATCEVTDELGPVAGVEVGLHNDGIVHYLDSTGELARKVITDASGLASFTVIPQQAGNRTILCMSPDRTFDFDSVDVSGNSSDWQLECDLSPVDIGEDYGQFIFQCLGLVQGEQLPNGTEVLFSASQGTIEPDDQVGNSGYAQVNYELQASGPTSVIFTLDIPSFGASDLRWVETVPIGLPDTFEPSRTLNLTSDVSERESQGIAFSDDRLAYFPSDRTIRISAYPSLQTLHTINWNGDDLNACDFSSDGATMACVDSDGDVFLVDPIAGSIGISTNITNDHTDALSVSWCGDNQHFVVGTEAGSTTYPFDAQMVLMDRNLSIQRRIDPPSLADSDFMRVACSAAAGVVAGNTWFDDPTTVVYDWNENLQLSRPHPDPNALWALALDDTGEWLAFGGDDNNGFYWLHLYRRQQGQWQEQDAPGSSNSRIHAVGFAEHPSEGELLVVGGTDALELFRLGEVVPWRAHAPDPLSGHKRNRQIHWMQPRNELISASNDQQVVYPLMPDVEAPVISFNAESPVPFDVSSVEIAGTMTDSSEIIRSELTQGSGQPTALTLADGAFSVDVDLEVGLNSFLLEAEDEHGNPVSVPFEILRQADNLAPVVVCGLSPGSGPAGTLFDLSCEVSDNDTVALVELSLDAMDWMELTVGDGVATSGIDSTGWSAGDHTAAVQATDPTGNVGMTSLILVIDGTCHVLTLEAVGAGAAPIASPTSSAGCDTGAYHAGELIQLTASPDPGSTVESWSGTDEDSSTALINAVTMPSAAHTVSVAYGSSTSCYPLTLSHTGLGADPIISGRAATQGNGTIHVTGGTLAGQPLSSSEWTIAVDPGASITGSVDLSVTNHMGSNAVAPLGYTWTWGARQSALTTINGWIPTGTTTWNVGIDLTAPTLPGIYYLLFGFNGEFNVSQVFGVDNWSAGGGVIWFDGNDYHDLGAGSLAAAQRDGFATDWPYRFGADLYLPRDIPVAPVKVAVGTPACPDGYFREGDVIPLRAAPTDPWQVAGWSGTDDDGSTSERNQVTMPAAAVSVSAHYVDPTAPTTESHLDRFDAVSSYSGDHGDRLWPGPWRETPADGGSAGWGHVRVITDSEVDFGVSQLRIRRDGMWVERPVDTSGAGSATWRFDYRRESLLDGHYVAAEVSSDGSSWAEVARISGPADDTDYGSMEVSIPTDSAWIRFANPAGLGMGNGNMVFFDNVEVVLGLGASMLASVEADPNMLLAPGGSVTFGIAVENTSPSGGPSSGTLVLDTLDYSLAGGGVEHADGMGTCSLPQSIASGEIYVCQFDLPVMGAAGETVDLELSAAGVVGAEAVSDVASTQIRWIEAVDANVRDAFNSLSYSGDDGSVPWASDWIESPLDGSQPGWGDIRIIEDSVVPHPEGPYQAFIRDDQLWLRRKMDLTGFSTAELDFEFRRENLLPGQKLDLEVSTDGVSFERLASIEGSISGTDFSYQRWSPALDLSPYIGSSVWIQLSNLEDLGMGNSNGVYFDNFEVRLQAGNAIAVELTTDPTSVVEPSGPVSFEVTVTNHSPSSVMLTDLADDQLGDLNGLGSCVVPQSLAAGAAYTCAYVDTISGSAGTVVTHGVSATASVGPEMLTAEAAAEVAVEAAGLETLRDELNTVAFNGNDGTLLWSSPWIESVSDGGAAYHGHVRIEPDPVGSGPYALRIRRDGLEVRRSANLTGFGGATLSFSYRRNHFQSGHRADVEVSLDGEAWTTLDALVGPALDLSYQSASINLTPWISPSTWIRFHVPAGLGMGNGNLIYLDDIEIELTDPVEGGRIDDPGMSQEGNLLRNASFTEGLGYWQLSGSDIGGIAPSSPRAGRSGRPVPGAAWGSAQISGREGRYALSQCVQVEANASYAFGTRFRVASKSELDPSISMVAEYFETDSCEGEVLASAGELLWLGPSDRNTWQQGTERRTTAPAAATSARVWLVVQGEGHGVFRAWLDEVRFRRLPSAP